MNWKIPLSDIDFGPEEEQAVLRVLRSRWLSMGGETQSFEREFANALGVRHAIAVSSGTAALHLGMLALGIGPNDLVIQPAVNFVSAANMTIAVGAIPVFSDICSVAEPTISPGSISSAISEAKEKSTGKPKAIVVMHYGGYPCRMEEIKAMCQKHGLALIEDACHGVGAKCGLEKLGSMGDIGCFSFFSNKNLVTGEGGMITTNNEHLADRVRLLRSHGMTSLTWDRHKGHAASYNVTCHGFNYRIDEIRSAIGREQLKKLARNNARRQALTSLYWEKLSPLMDKNWTLPFYETSRAGDVPGCHLLPIVAPDPETRRKCADMLKDSGIQTSLHYPFIPDFTAFAQYNERIPLNNASKFCSSVITLPLYPTMSEACLLSVTDHLINAARNKG